MSWPVEGWGFAGKGASFATTNPALGGTEAGRSALGSTGAVPTLDGAGLRSAVSVVRRAGDGGAASISRSRFGEIEVDGMGASAVTPGLAIGGTKDRGGSGVLGLAVAGVIVTPSD